ncbi:MAG: LacI family DNA-binding transcriptional regulator [Ancalomicrobiaceae bacterium]|nr:LacI family DNA-binding transcriptional regulator [Ancalomicrobiaceae bacterium]
MRRRGMKDIARAAGLSLSTVDRVLNNRGLARSATAERVLGIAAELGYLPGNGLVGSGRHRFDVVIPAGGNTFLDRLSAAFEAAAARRADEITLHVRRIPSFAVSELCNALDEITLSDGVGVIALDHPLVCDALKRLRDRDIPVATLVSDVPGIDRIGFVGVDNRAAGRLAGQLIHRFVRTAGTVAIFRGSPSYRGHEERENGCRAILAELAPAMQVVLAEETRDQVEASRVAMLNLIERYPELVAVYNVADGNPGIVAALVEAGRAKDVVFVAHELSDVARASLIAGTLDAVIDQDVTEEAEKLLTLLTRNADGLEIETVPRVHNRVFFSENLP